MNGAILVVSNRRAFDRCGCCYKQYPLLHGMKSQPLFGRLIHSRAMALKLRAGGEKWCLQLKLEMILRNQYWKL